MRKKVKYSAVMIQVEADSNKCVKSISSVDCVDKICNALDNGTRAELLLAKTNQNESLLIM